MEAKHINVSLFFLEMVIVALRERGTKGRRVAYWLAATCAVERGPQLLEEISGLHAFFTLKCYESFVAASLVSSLAQRIPG